VGNAIEIKLTTKGGGGKKKAKKKSNDKRKGKGLIKINRLDKR
jgi:hypothetical protein